ncbi:MAG: hypothetical protein ACLTR6_10615 [Clostridium fessum]
MQTETPAEETTPAPRAAGRTTMRNLSIRRRYSRLSDTMGNAG